MVSGGQLGIKRHKIESKQLNENKSVTRVARRRKCKERTDYSLELFFLMNAANSENGQPSFPVTSENCLPCQGTEKRVQIEVVALLTTFGILLQ